jgi:hypothetical protein
VLNVVDSWLSLHELSVDIISLLNRRQRLLLNILLDPLLLIRPLPLGLVLLIINHEQYIRDPEVLDEQLELLQIEPIIGGRY